METESETETRIRVNLGGIIHFSTIDWRGKAAIVIFLRRCPFRCIYCQNYNLIETDNYVDMKEIEEAIRDSEDFIDAVVLSGGEPFMQPDAIAAISKYARQRSLYLGVQTNGYYPDAVEALLDADAFDKIFLDIKAPLGTISTCTNANTNTNTNTRYEELTKVHGVSERVRKTLEILLAKDVDAELITTVFKNIVGAAEVKQIVEELHDMGATCYPYVIQQGRIERIPPDAGLSERNIFSYEELEELASLAYHTAPLKEVRIRTRERGEEVMYKYK